MKEVYSVEIDRYNPMALANTLKKLSYGIPGFKYEWKLLANGGGIDYGVFLNINVITKEIEICNQPELGTDGEDMIEEVIEYFDKDEDGVTMYHDTVSGEIISKEDLRKEYEYLFENGETETPTFGGYLRDCLSKNGTVEEITVR